MSRRQRAKQLPVGYARPWSKQNPYDYRGFRGDDGVEVGCGERMVTYELEGTHVLGARGHDVVLPDGRRVEVKALFNKTFHAASDGRGSISGMVAEVERVCRSGATALALMLEDSKGWEWSQIIQRAVESIEHRELQKGLFWGGTPGWPHGLVHVVGMLSKVFNPEDTKLCRSGLVVVDALGGRSFMESAMLTRSEALFKLMKDFPTSGYVKSLPAADVLQARLRDPDILPYVLDPKKFEVLWNSSYLADSFRNADQVCLVHPEEGYALVPTEELQKMVSLERVSRGDPYFKLRAAS